MVPVIAKATIRRVMLLSVSAICISSSALAAAPQVRTQAPGFYRMMLGDFEVTALLDGTHPFPDEAVLTIEGAAAKEPRAKLFAEKPEEANSLLKATAQTAQTEGSIDAFLINTGSKLILIDSGAGTLYGACCGHLLDNLRAAGYRPDQVDEILLTHLHADHVGGIAPGGQPAFPNAVIRSSKLDADYWLNDVNENAAPAFLRPMFEGDKASLKPYIATGRFRPFEGKQQLEPGITVEYDSNEAEAEATRKKVFGDASAEGFWIAAAHISFPGLGHVGMEAGQYRWIQGEYTTRIPAPVK